MSNKIKIKSEKLRKGIKRYDKENNNCFYGNVNC